MAITQADTMIIDRAFDRSPFGVTGNYLYITGRAGGTIATPPNLLRSSSIRR
jgi:hypothetical protein